MSKPKKRRPILKLAIFGFLTAALAVGAMFGQSWLRDFRANRLAVLQEAAIARNTEQDLIYQAAIADFESTNSGGGNLAWPTQAMTGWDVLDLTTYPLEIPYTTTLARQDLMYNGMLLVNQWHSRPEDFQEGGLVSVGSYTAGKVQVDNYNINTFPFVIDAWRTLLADAEAVGLKDYMIQEGYRSYERQNELFTAEMTKLSSRYSGDDLIEHAKLNVNYPGTSEYNSGLSLRVRLYNKTDASVGKATFSTSQQGLWLAENCWKYGFVFRFPVTDFPVKGTVDKSYKTGISSKMNLYRYVGVPHATVMHVKDFCLEEYIEFLQAHPHIAVFEEGQLKYEIVRQQVGDGEEFTVQLTGRTSNWTASLDNMGGVIIVFQY